MRKILEECPACGSDLVITQLSCTRCTTVVNGHFQATPFARLSADQLQFLETFVKSKGNVKEMERELGISYWAIRNQINDMIAELGFDTEPLDTSADAQARHEILQRVETGEITIEEAARLLEES
ncbi:MAG: DUF2089 domain-containing protein [Anaerolineales bacterium]|nr:DUF2089 domain-containing protein [Anaerolineales bacterium]MCB0031142.1 DUF2089 domain-containing protein [Anaerolineales bacterium]MCB8959150.1 DUF2089 domain-containing protein [Ardenticatenales bacterium]